MAEWVAAKILIVEDEFLLAMELEDYLMAMGHEVIGSATRFDQALELASNADIDFAVLDINLAGTQTFPIADILAQRGIPFVFASGYGSEGLVDGYRHNPILRKPYEPNELKRILAASFPSVSR